MSFENPAISCDTESTEERKFSDLETEVEQSDEARNDCNHRYTDRFGITQDFRRHFTGHLETLKRYAFCPLCGVAL